jgi:shikimate dehydrogenase
MSISNEEQLSHTTSLLRVGLIGNPVAHSYSPRFQQAAFDALGIPARYELWQTPASELPARVASLRASWCLGANITIPYKEAVLPLVDVVDPLAARIGAVNTIVHRNEYLYGYNTDAPGLLRALVEQGVGRQLENAGVSLKGYTAVLLGAGGAARSAAFALVSASIDGLIIVNRNLERAQQLAAEVQQDSACQVFSLSNPDFLIPRSTSLIINATPVGMHFSKKQAGEEGQVGEGGRAGEGGRWETEDVSPLPAEVLARFDAGTFVLDMIYNPVQTQLLRQARNLGLRAANGLSMLLHQGALAFTLWTGQPAPLEIMRSTLL